jgi:hypothetical protein
MRVVGLLDWFRPRPRARFVNEIARELAEVVFALHPAAADRVVLQLGQAGGRRVVVMMDVPTTDPARTAAPSPDPAASTARITELVAELGRKVPTGGNELTVMRDRVIWMPAVVPFNPPVA